MQAVPKCIIRYGTCNSDGMAPSLIRNNDASPADWGRRLPVVASVVIALSYLIVFLPETIAEIFLTEDGPLEYATAVFFLVACSLFAATYHFAGKAADRLQSQAQRRIFFLLLAILMLVCAGEELSWGQRIFHWKTPVAIEHLNAQGETNLHNSWVLHAKDSTGQRKSFLRLLINAERLFSIFWLSIFVMVPLLGRFSATASRVIAKIGLPVAPLSLGGLFLLNYAFFRLGIAYLPSNYLIDADTGLDELKECNYALVYAVAGVLALGMQRRGARPARPETVSLPVHPMANPRHRETVAARAPGI